MYDKIETSLCRYLILSGITNKLKTLNKTEPHRPHGPRGLRDALRDSMWLQSIPKIRGTKHIGFATRDHVVIAARQTIVVPDKQTPPRLQR